MHEGFGLALVVHINLTPYPLSKPEIEKDLALIVWRGGSDLEEGLAPLLNTPFGEQRRLSLERGN